jgi:hypothetical protein
MLQGDSWHYELITQGVELSKNTDGLCLEIGLRLGGGSKYILDAVKKFCPSKVCVAIDPYGSILYEHKEKHFVRLDYTEDMKAECLSNIYKYSKQLQIPFIFINLEDTEFFKRYSDGIPVYNEVKQIQNKYSFIHFDGPHAIQPILDEIDFFLPRIDSGACFVFDDIGGDGDVYYDHEVIENYLFEKGFKLITKTVKKGLYQYEG